MLASFGQLGVISDLHINFQKSWNGFNDHRKPNNINYTVVKYGETIYGRHKAETLFVINPCYAV